MEIISMIILAIGLSMDSLVIALTSGAVMGNHHFINILKVAGMLAFMQASLTLFGWLVGSTFASYIDKYDHWLAFGILFFLGARVIWEALRNEEKESFFNPLNIKVMFSLAVATSIDAVAVGLSLSLVNQSITMPVIVIGLVTFIISSLGIIFGSKVGHKYNSKINIIGGVILIFIGLFILAEHTVFASQADQSFFF